MAKTKTNSLLVDRYGKAMAISAYSTQTRKLNNPNYTDYRGFLGNGNENPYKFLNPSERRLINQFALDLFRSSPTIHAAINRKNEWTCATGWKPLYKGGNAAWGKQATRFLNDVVYPNCSTQGRNMTFNRLLLTIANQLDIAGDILLTYVQTREGLLKLQLFPSSMIGSRIFGKTLITEGRYKGAEIDDGVILSNTTGMPIAYRLLQDKKEDDYDIGVRDAQLIFEPTDLCNRGISVIAPSLLTMLSAEGISSALNQTVHNLAKQQFVVSTKTGTGEDYASDSDLDADLSSTTTDTTPFVPKVVNLGPVAFVDAKNGEDIKPFTFDAPHMNSQDWIRYLTEGVIYDLGWALPLISPEKLNSANMQAIESQVQNTISVRQETLKRVANLYTLAALALAMETGDLPKLNNDDWRYWDWSKPAAFTLKSTTSEDIQGLNSGTTTFEQVASSNGGDWQEIRNQRQVELVDACTRAKEIHKQFPELSFERCLNMVGIGSNPIVAPLSEQKIATGELPQ